MCVYDSASGLHKYLYVHANPVNNIDPSGNITITGLLVGVTLRGMVARSLTRATIAASINIAIQARLYMMISPLEREIRLLGEELNSLKAGTGNSLIQGADALKTVISAPTVAGSIAVPAAAAAFLGLKGSALVTGVRTYQLNNLASSAVGIAANGVQYNNGFSYFSFSGQANVRRSGAKAFLGFLNPSQDVALLRNFVYSWQSRSAQGLLDDFNAAGRALGKYGSFSGQLGVGGSAVTSNTALSGSGGANAWFRSSKNSFSSGASGNLSLLSNR